MGSEAKASERFERPAGAVRHQARPEFCKATTQISRALQNVRPQPACATLWRAFLREYRTFCVLFQRLRTQDLGIPWEGPWKLYFGRRSGALAKLALKRRFGLFLEPANGGGSTLGRF